MEVKALGRIRKLLESIDAASPGDDEQLALTRQLEQLVAFGAAPWREVVRPGRAFWTGTTTAVAAVTAIPTTAVLFALYNNAEDGGRSLVIDWVGAVNAVSVTATANQAQLIGNVGQVRETAPTDAALSIKKLNGMGAGTPDTKVRSILTATALPATTGVAANWFPLGASATKASSAANTTPGYGMWAAVDGRIIVPPGRYFAIHVMANTTGETFNGFIGWHEVQLELG